MNSPHSRRSGFTSTDLLALFVSVFVLVLIVAEGLFCQSPNQPGLDNVANRTACAANLRSIAQSMTIYAQSNEGVYPCTPGPDTNTYSNAPQSPTGYAPNQTAGEIIADWYGNGQDPTGASCGNPLACLWILVLQGQDTPRTFICPSDPIANSASQQWGPVVGAVTPSFPNFGFMAITSTAPNTIGRGESYSIADPWLKVQFNPNFNTHTALLLGAPGNANHVVYAASDVWINDSRADQPIACDMAPADIKAAGKFNRDTTISQGRAISQNITYLFNSGNHNGNGQNIAFGDTHVEWDISPYVGQQGDNIFTFNTTNVPMAGGTPLSDLGTNAKLPNIQTYNAPYDTCMIPVRNVKTGQW
ncbi:MAG TPA: hypothetical protein VMG59_04550 [Phycisphaerae bacterium]|nr:hypothetical protein [Phycisphaerae bacterium]